MNCAVPALAWPEAVPDLRDIAQADYNRFQNAYGQARQSDADNLLALACIAQDLRRAWAELQRLRVTPP